MSADERIDAIREKIKRAKKHIDDFELIGGAFIRQAEPDVFRVDTDPETGNEITTINKLAVPPVDTGLIAGDAIHNLRSALDHLAYQLVLVAGNTPSPGTGYPIFATAERYKTYKAGKVEGMSDAAKNFIDTTKPYLGGTDELYWLHALDIADKHHALVVTLVAVHGAMVISPARWFRPDHKPCYTLQNLRTPLKVGDVVLIREPNCEDQVDLAPDVAFSQPKIVEGKPVFEFLQQTTELIDRLIVDFRPYLG